MGWVPRYSRMPIFESLSSSRAAQGCADELPGETVRMCRLSMIMAFYGVGHVLANRVPGLKAAQEATTVVWYC